ncbi:MAG: glycosyltransferase family 2 protein [Leadbetterella sp.]
MSVKLLLVLPCYNEEAILKQSNQTLHSFFEQWINGGVLSNESRICYVNDGSKDATWSIIEDLSKSSPWITAIKLSKNFGHQNAVLAGLFQFKNDFDAFISIDADLQDDPSVIKEMVEKFRSGAHVVYGVRDDRTTDSFFKKTTAESFYKLMLSMKIPIVFNHADFRLMSQTAVLELSQYPEYQMFLRGVVPTLGFASEKVFYKRQERTAGESKYPLRKMISFAWGGITSFTNYPMRLVLWFGILNFFIAILMGVYVLVSKITGNALSGWTSIVLPMAYFSGCTMVAIGLMGEYIGRIFDEVKARPRYIVEKVLDK